MFSNTLFWQNVELLPGGIEAENWLASKNGQVEWAWAGTSTYGRYEWVNGNYVPFVYIPQRYDERYAAQVFVHNVVQDYSIFGWAGYSKIPDPGNIDGWRDYIKQIQTQQIKVVSGAAQVALAAAQITNEGADWVININDLQNAQTTGEVAMAMIAFLPFVTGSMLKIRSVVNGVSTDVLKISAKQAQEMKALQNAGIIAGNPVLVAVHTSDGAGSALIFGRMPRNGSRPVQAQAAYNTCGPTSVGMVLDTVDAGRDSTKLINLGLDSDGVSIDRLAAMLRQNGISATWEHSFTIDDIAKATAGGSPLIAHVRVPGGGHFVVVDGVTTRMGQRVVAIRDPAGGQQYFELASVFSRSSSGQVVILH